MNPLLEQLHDIEGIDFISSWPLAIGWWLLIVVGIFLLGGGIFFGAYKLAFKRSWKNDALKKLNYLEKNLSDDTAKESLRLLSEYLRRIALRRFSRNECAGLTGEEWLKWLSLHDQKGFEWEKKGTLLNQIPYAPSKSSIEILQVKELIQAAKKWVC